MIPEPVLDELERSLTETQAQFDAGNSAKHFESDIYFHGTILDFVENRLLKEVLDSLNNCISILRRFGQLQPGPHLVEFLREHRAILEAIRQRDADRAYELMMLHLDRSALRLQELVQ